MVVVVLCAETRAALKTAGLGEEIASSGALATAPHGAMLRAGLTLVGREVHLCHADAAAAHAPPPKRDAALERRMAALRARAADAEYARMVRDVSRSGGGDNGGAAASRAIREATPHASMALNVVATMGTCFAAAYFLVRAATGSRSLALGAGAIGLALALAVEVILILARIYALDRAAERKVTRHQRNIERRARSAASTDAQSLGSPEALPVTELPEELHSSLPLSKKKKQ